VHDYLVCKMQYTLFTIICVQYKPICKREIFQFPGFCCSLFLRYVLGCYNRRCQFCFHSISYDSHFCFHEWRNLWSTLVVTVCGIVTQFVKIGSLMYWILQPCRYSTCHFLGTCFLVYSSENLCLCLAGLYQQRKI
jgi:hypothetical protein